MSIPSAVPPEAAGAGVLPAGMSVPEAVVLIRQQRPGQLDVDARMPTAAALIELAVCGRLGTVPRRSFFKHGNDQDLVVLDPRPTGDAALDAALAVLVTRAKPIMAEKAWLAVYRGVLAAVHAGLLVRGIATPVPGRRWEPGHLRIDDQPGYERERASLSRLASSPEAVTDPRAGAFIDVLRNGADQYRTEEGLHPAIRWEWYPASARLAVEAILLAERSAFSS